MLNFKPHNFVYICQVLAQIGQVHEFAQINPAVPRLQNLTGLSAALAGIQNDSDSKTERTRKVKIALDVLDSQCEILGLKFSCKKIKAVIKDIERDENWFDQSVLKEVSSRIHDELSEGMYFQIPQENSLYFERSEKWQNIIDKNPKLSADIDEAGKCLSMSRYTASVFHLMRVMERGLQIMGKKLSVSDSQNKQWGNIIDSLETEIESRWPSKNKQLTGPQKKKRQAYHEALSYLKSVRLAWRNEVMHPKETYTETEAINIYNAVHAFMDNILSLT